MKKYMVSWEITQSGCTEVEADSAEAAEDIIREKDRKELLEHVDSTELNVYDTSWGRSREEIIELWKNFEDTPVNADDTIDAPYFLWPAGTPRVNVIWAWFNEQFEEGLAAYMNGVAN